MRNLNNLSSLNNLFRTEVSGDTFYIISNITNETACKVSTKQTDEKINKMLKTYGFKEEYSRYIELGLEDIVLLADEEGVDLMRRYGRWMVLRGSGKVQDINEFLHPLGYTKGKGVI